MDTQVEKKTFKITPKNIIIISLVCFILLCVSAASQLAFTVLKQSKIYNGVYVNGINAANMSTGQLTDVLKTNLLDRGPRNQLEIKAGNYSEKVSFSEISVNYDVESAVQEAYNVGRSGNIFERIYDIIASSKKNVSLTAPYTYDKKIMDDKISSLAAKIQVNVKEPELLILEDSVIIRSGHHGVDFDKTKFLNEIEENIRNCKSAVIAASLIDTLPDKINIDTFMSKINTPAKDASVQVENNNVKVIPHVVGRSIDKSTLSAIISDLEKSEDTEKVLPVVFIKPGISSDDINAMLFRDTLYTKSTQFYTNNQNNANRGENIKIAISKINGKILGPGETFSFNDVVGARTEAGGYKVAHVYSGGKVIDDIGGGICQVSTTLYNAALFSDLAIVERHNHMFTVGYVPYGLDAAVSYGTVDFKFKNSTLWPLRIDGWVTKDNKIFFSLKGTNENKDKSIAINSQIVKVLDFAIKDIPDPTLDEGIDDVKTEGMKGYVVETYKTVKQAGKTVSQDKIYTSVYKPLNREVHHGTRKVIQSTPTPTPVSTPTPQPTVQPTPQPTEQTSSQPDV